MAVTPKTKAGIRGNRQANRDNEEELARVERETVCRSLALERRLEGHSYRDIAIEFTTMFGEVVETGTVFRWVEDELLHYREKTTLDAKLVFEMDLGRLDKLLKFAMKAAGEGSAVAINAAVRVLERRAKMIGLDAPSKSEWVGALTAITPEAASKMSQTDIDERVRLLMERVSQTRAGLLPAKTGD